MLILNRQIFPLTINTQKCVSRKIILILTVIYYNLFIFGKTLYFVNQGVP